MAAVTRTGKPTVTVSHPDWCDPARCGHLVPPVMTHMARRHRGEMLRVGETRGSGMVVTYLIGAEARSPMIAVHATSRAGNGWAELSVSQAAQLVERLGALVAQAGSAGSDDD
ncbi:MULTISPECIES: hypothetical protein [unclassified Micromonospora]|uniref:hypothetical protein n=1 Tax=unclassified Micromonospora TaxID=2617518 RepID=UPI002FF1F0A7